MEFLNALFSAALDQNIVFCQLVGMVAILLVAERSQDSIRFGLMLWVACTLSGIIGWLVYTGFMVPWGLTYMASAIYMLVSCAVIMIAAAIWASSKPTKNERTKIWHSCMLVAVCAAVQAVPLSMAASADIQTLDIALGSAIGSGLGVFVAVVLFAYIHDRIDECLVPRAMRGLPISLVTAALMAMAFTGVAGIAGGLFV